MCTHTHTRARAQPFVGYYEVYGLFPSTVPENLIHKAFGIRITNTVKIASKDGPATESICCSCKRLRFSFQQLHHVTHNSLYLQVQGVEQPLRTSAGVCTHKHIPPPTHTRLKTKTKSFQKSCSYLQNFTFWPSAILLGGMGEQTRNVCCNRRVQNKNGMGGAVTVQFHEIIMEETVQL